jgi:competence protein ComGB
MNARRELLVKIMFHRKWKKVDQAEFLIRVGECLNKGYTLANAINMQAYEQSPKVKVYASQILQNLKKGQTVSDVFLSVGFPQVSCSFLFFSMQTGQLSQGFLEGGRYLKLKEAQKEKFNKLMRYPLFLIWIFAFMFYLIVNQLLPNFKQLYKAMSIDMPYSVKLLLSIPTHLGILLTLLLAAIGIIALLAAIYYRTFTLSQRLTHLSKIPFISSFLRMYLSYYFAFHMGGLLKVGLSVNDALMLVENQNYQPFFKMEAIDMRKSLVGGIPLPEIIRKRLYYTLDLPIVVKNGEAQGKLGITLQDYSQLVFNHLEEKISQALSLIQPLFFILFGGLIVGLFLSILTPMFAILNGL